MLNDNNLIDYRCGRCNKLFFRAIILDACVVLKCVKCSRYNYYIEGDSFVDKKKFNEDFCRKDLVKSVQEKEKDKKVKKGKIIAKK